jgi:hypothetical protein
VLEKEAIKEPVMHVLALVLSTMSVGLGLLLSASPASAQSCGDLWYQRNSIYKQAGYCFKTARAISAFGNAGCSYDNVSDVPLSPRQGRIVAAIRAQERGIGCPP